MRGHCMTIVMVTWVLAMISGLSWARRGAGWGGGRPAAGRVPRHPVAAGLAAPPAGGAAAAIACRRGRAHDRAVRDGPESAGDPDRDPAVDRKSTRLNSSH